MYHVISAHLLTLKQGTPARRQSFATLLLIFERCIFSYIVDFLQLQPFSYFKRRLVESE